MDSPRETFMRETDAFTWRMEDDPGLRSTIVAVAWLAAPPAWGTLVDRLDRATRAVPSFRQVVVEPPARLATPRWTVAPGFDLGWHLRRVEAPAPHDAAAVADLARTAATTAFDPARPLWEFTLVEGLAGGRAALLMKVHHALTDGVGGIELAPLLFDLDATAAPPAAPPEPAPPAPPAERVGTAGLVRESVAHQSGRALRLAGRVATAVPGAVRTARHPLRSVGDAVAVAGSIGRTVAPVTRTLSPVMTGRSLGRHLDLLTIPLADLRAAARAAQGTVNDALLVGVTGGLARYHERLGAPVTELRVTMPVSIRRPDDPAGGNRITLQRFTVPVGVGATVDRLRAVGARCRAARSERSLAHTDTIAGVLNLLPAGLLGGMLKHVDVLASNVPAFPRPVYLAGAEVVGLCAWGPTTGAALNATLLSYRGTCAVGVNLDTAAVPDPGPLVDCLAEGFAELAALAGRRRPSARVGRPLAAGRVPGPPRRRRAGT